MQVLRYWCCRWSIHGLHSWNRNPKRWLELSESFTNKKLIKEQSSLSKTHTVLKAVLGKDKIKREMHSKFHLVYLFRNQLERFWRNFRASFKTHKPASKTKALKICNWDLLMTFSFLFWKSCTSNALIDGAGLPFSREKVFWNVFNNKLVGKNVVILAWLTKSSRISFRELIFKPSIKLRKVFDRHFYWNLRLVSLAKSTSSLPKPSRPKSPSSGPSQY